MVKRCVRCCEEKPVEEFYAYRGRVQSYCKPCAISRSALWHKENPERVRELGREWYRRTYVKKPPRVPRIKWQHYSWGEFVGPLRPTPDAFWVLLVLLVKAEKTRKKALENKKRWLNNHPEKLKALNRHKSSKKKHRFKVFVESLYRTQKGRCVACKTSLDGGYHIDHIYPRSRGGSNDKENLQLLCPDCNQKKSDRHPVEFMQEMGLLL